MARPVKVERDPDDFQIADDLAMRFFLIVSMNRSIDLAASGEFARSQAPSHFAGIFS